MKTKIYWSPYFVDMNKYPKDWTILYQQPQILNKHLLERRNPDTNKMFLCPAFTNLSKKVAVVRFPFDSKYSIKDGKIEQVSSHSLEFEVSHEPSIKNNILVEFYFCHLFFCEEDVNITLTAPYFSNSPHMRFGAVVPGTFNISKWFRPIVLEMNLWEGVSELEFKKDEHIFYVHFDTENDIEFVQFTMSDEIRKISDVCSDATAWEKNVPIHCRYERFEKSNLNKILIREIKKNIVE